MSSALACSLRAGWLAGLLGQDKFVVARNPKAVQRAEVVDRDFTGTAEQLPGRNDRGSFLLGGGLVGLCP